MPKKTKTKLEEPEKGKEDEFLVKWTEKAKEVLEEKGLN